VSRQRCLPVGQRHEALAARENRTAAASLFC
jgi:hypothetical protein